MEKILRILFNHNNTHSWLNPTTGAWHIIICNQHTHQDWVFTEDSWNCIRFNVTMPNYNSIL